MEKEKVSMSKFKSSSNRMIIIGKKRNPLDILRGSVLRYVDPTTPIDVKWKAGS